MTTHKQAIRLAELAYFRKWSDATGQSPTEHPDDGDGPIGYAIRAYLEARGLVMVPKEPTAEMIEEGDYLLVDTDAERFASSSVYRAMLSAAPDPFGDAP